MREKLEISHSVNLFKESFILLYYWANVDELEKVRDEYINLYQNDLDNYIRKFNHISEIYSYVKDNLKVREEKIKYYFKERNSGMSTFASLAMLWDRHIFNKEPITYEEYFQNLTDSEKLIRFAKIIDDELVDTLPNDQLKSLQDLIRFIESSSYETEAKWEALKIFNHIEIYYNEVNGLLDETMKLLLKYKTQLDELCQEFYDYWKDYHQNSDLIKNIEEKAKFIWKYSEKGISVEPLIFYPFSLTLSYDEIPNRTKDVLQISIFLDHRFELTNKKISKDDVISFGKILCDKSKLDILEYLGKKSAYGKEIADELNLTTATISYHVKTLQALGFLNTIVDSNKVIYSLNQEGILSYMDGVKRYFTEL